MIGPLALAVNAIAAMSVRYGSVASLAPLTEVEIRCWVNDGHTFLVAEATNWLAAYEAGYSNGHLYWRDICRLVPVAEPAARVCLCDFPHGDAHLSTDHQPAATSADGGTDPLLPIGLAAGPGLHDPGPAPSTRPTDELAARTRHHGSAAVGADTPAGPPTAGAADGGGPAQAPPSAFVEVAS